MKIPHPYNPQHTANLASVKLLEAQGWKGPDMSLDISLSEYGFAYREMREPDMHGDDLLIIYRLTDRQGADRFDRVSVQSGRDLKEEYDWVDWKGFYRTMDTDAEEFHASPAWRKLYDLMCVYGYENVFGSSYWEGFTIETND